MTIGDTLSIETNYDNSLFSIISSDSSVIKVLEGNNIQAMSEGTATISASSAINTDSILLIVTAEAIPTIEFAITSPSNEASMVPGDTLPIITTYPNNSFSISSSDSSVIRISSGNIIEAMSEGTATISASSSINTDSIILSVAAEAIPSIEFAITSPSNETSMVPGDTLPIITTYPNNSFSISSSDSSVIRISSGNIIEAISEGTATIIAHDLINTGTSKSISVTVAEDISDDTFNTYNRTSSYSKTFTVDGVTLTITRNSNQSVTYQTTSSRSGILIMRGYMKTLGSSSSLSSSLNSIKNSRTQVPGETYDDIEYIGGGGMSIGANPTIRQTSDGDFLLKAEITTLSGKILMQVIETEEN